MTSLSEYERELIRRNKCRFAICYSKRSNWRQTKGYTKETISKLLVMRSVYKNPTLAPEEIYDPFGLTRATFYRYAKILDNHTDEEIKKMSDDIFADQKK